MESTQAGRRWDRGQLQRGAAVGNRRPVEGRVRAGSFAEMVLERLNDWTLLDHEANVIDLLADGNNVVFTGPEGPPSYGVGCLAVAVAALHGMPTLVLCPDAEQADRFRDELVRQFAFRLPRVRPSSGGWRGKPFAGCASVGSPVDAGGLQDMVAPFPTVAVATAEALFSSTMRSLPEESLERWLRSVEFVWLHRFDRLSTEGLQTLGYMLEAHRWLRARPRYGGSSRRLDGLDATATELFSAPSQVVSASGLGSNRYSLHQWLPPLEAEGDVQPDGRVRVRRRTPGEELQLAILPDVLAGKEERLLIWDTSPSIGPERLVALREQLIDEISSLSSGAASEATPEPRVVRELSEIPWDWWGEVDRTVMLGWPAGIHPTAVREQLGVLMADGGTVVHLVTEDPLSNAVLRGAEGFEAFLPRPSSTTARTPDLDSAMLQWALSQRSYAGTPPSLDEEGFVEASRFEAAFRGGLERVRSALGDVLSNSALEEGGLSGLDPKQINPFRDSEWPVASPDRVVLGRDHGGPVLASPTELPFALFPGAIRHVDGVPYEVEAADPVAESPGRRLVLLRALQPGERRVPIIAVEFSGTTEGGKRSVSGLEIALGSGDGQVSCLGYMRLGTDELGTSKDRERTIRFDRAVQLGVEGMPYCDLMIGSGAVGCSSLMSSFLRMFLPQHGDEFACFPVQDSVVRIVGSHRSLKPAITSFFRTADDLLPNFLRFGYWVLEACPCATGCPRCLEYPFRMRVLDKDGEARGFDKEGTMRRIGELLGMRAEDVATDLQYKSEGLPADQAAARYDKALNEILRCFELKLRLPIAQLASMEASAREDGGDSWDGLYYGGRNHVKIKAPLRAARSWEVIAHEYAHNWQYEGADGGFAEVLRTSDKWPHDGKLFLEGFAQWVAFKIADYFGMRDNADQINVRVDDEYGDGFAMFRDIEAAVGFAGALDFARQGSLRISDEEVLGPEEVIRRFAPVKVRAGFSKGEEFGRLS